MSLYGKAPLADEIEISLFGPGFGESVAVHLGEGNWLLIDSCIDPESKKPAVLTYFNQIGVDPATAVRVLLASHWHDDHVKGISTVAAAMPKAEFFMSSVFDDDKAAEFLAAYNAEASFGKSTGTRELFQVTKDRDYEFVHQRSQLIKGKWAGRDVCAMAISPVSAAFAQALARMAHFLPHVDDANNDAPEMERNLESVAVHIDFGDDAVLLGADLEEDAKLGWTAVTQHPWVANLPKSSVFKVAHHGGFSAECPAVWTNMLQPEPVACLTPFNLGRVHLPSADDAARLKGKTPHRYITSGASSSPQMDSRVLKRLKDMCKSVAVYNTGFGVVRLRKQPDVKHWSVELFGAAQKL